jgi:carbonic anhydrase/acetyltransferase-like protein (isoleucine patch superfamily)
VLITIAGSSPACDPTSWTAPGAVLAGQVTLGPGANVWYGSVVRADLDRITIGAGSNVQDGCVLHTDPGLHLEVGEGVTVGHRAVLHGCRIEDDVIVGMGAVVLNGAVVGAGSIIGAGALLTEGVVVPPRSLVLGSPGKVRRSTTDQELEHIRLSASHYVELARQHAQGLESRTQQ